MAKRKRYISIALVILMCIGFFTIKVTAVTMEDSIKSVTNVAVNLRKQPTMTNKPFHVEIPKNTFADVSFRIKTDEGEFAVACYEGKVGFIPTRYISLPSNVKTAKLVNTKTNVAVNHRVQPEKSNKNYYSEIPANRVVESYDILISTSEGTFWLCKYNGKYGFIPSKYANQISTTNQNPEGQTEGKKTITTAALDLRLDIFVEGAKVVMEIPKGAEVTVLSESFTSSDGYKITRVAYKGNFGYVKSKYLKGSKEVNYLTVTKERSLYNLSLYSTPDNTQNVLCEIPANAMFYVIGEEAGHKMVVYDGYCGYVPNKFGAAINTYCVYNAVTTKGGTGKRSINIRLACSKLTGTIVSKNTQFSWFVSHGQCLSSNGYVNAPVFTPTGTTQGIGGGVCQVASTINIVAKRIGIETNAEKHLYPVSYCNREDEATVTYPIQNFTFTNTTGKQITMLLYQTQPGSCTVIFLG